MPRAYPMYVTETSPIIAVRRTPDGFEQRRNPLWKNLALTSMLGIMVVGMSFLVVKIASTNDSRHIAAIVAFSIFLLLPLIVFATSIPKLVCFGIDTLTTSTWPIELGSEVRVRFTRRICGIQLFQAHATLRYIEIIPQTHRKGSYARRRTLWQETLLPMDLERSKNLVSAEWHIRMPERLPPAFERKATCALQLVISTPHPRFADTAAIFPLYPKPPAPIRRSQTRHV